MCGRFVQDGDREAVAGEFGVAVGEAEEFRRSYNIAPTQTVGAVRAGGAGREYAALRWGLVPAWAKDASFASKLINARAETLLEKPSFREAYKKRRCLVPASGFYEWETTPSGKRPHFFFLKDADLFSFGGLWEEWLDRETGEMVETFAIVTTEANELLRRVHERMPVIIGREDRDLWLRGDVEDVSGLLAPFDAGRMDSRTVSRAVNSPANDSPELIRETEEPADDQ